MESSSSSSNSERSVGSNLVPLCLRNSEEQNQISSPLSKINDTDVSQEPLIYSSTSQENSTSELTNQKTVVMKFDSKEDTSLSSAAKSCYTLEVFPKLAEDDRKVASCSNICIEKKKKADKEHVNLVEPFQSKELYCEQDSRKLNTSGISKYVARSCDGIYYETESIRSKDDRSMNESSNFQSEDQASNRSLKSFQQEAYEPNRSLKSFQQEAYEPNRSLKSFQQEAYEPNRSLKSFQQEAWEPREVISVDSQSFESLSINKNTLVVTADVPEEASSRTLTNLSTSSGISPKLWYHPDFDHISVLSTEAVSKVRCNHGLQGSKGENSPVLTGKRYNNFGDSKESLGFSRFMNWLCCMNIGTDSDDSFQTVRYSPNKSDDERNDKQNHVQFEKDKKCKERSKGRKFRKKMWKKS